MGLDFVTLAAWLYVWQWQLVQTEISLLNIYLTDCHCSQKMIPNDVGDLLTWRPLAPAELCLVPINKKSTFCVQINLFFLPYNITFPLQQNNSLC